MDHRLATLAHDLRTPLQAILNWSRVLRQTPPSAEELALGLEIIERNALAQVQMLDEALKKNGRTVPETEAAVADVAPPAIGAPNILPVNRGLSGVRAERASAPAAGVLPAAAERILIIDDEVDLRDLIARLLVGDGHAVRCAENVTQAVQIAREFEPTLIVVDWLIENGHDGADALRAVRDIVPQARAIVMSGLPSDQVRSGLGEIEVLVVLEKPFQVEALFQHIQRA